MPCEHYKDALIESVARGEEPNAVLRLHLGACDACREFFFSERALFSAIDSSVRQSLNADVPPSLLPRVRARLAEEFSPRRGWIRVSVAGAIAAALIVGFLLLRGARLELKARPEFAPGSVALNTLPSQKAAAQHNAVPKRRNWKVPRNAAGVEAVQSVPAADEPVVLVPAAQQRGVAWLIAAARRGEVKEDLLVAVVHEHEPELPELAPLEIAPIGIPPLEEDPRNCVRGLQECPSFDVSR